MSKKLNRILFYLSIFSLVVLFFIEIFSNYDTTTRQIALSLTCAAVIIILLIIFRVVRSKLNIELPFYVAWVAAVGVWFDALGNFAGLYGKIIWWDKLSHAVGSGAMAIALFVIFYELNKQGKIKLGRFNLSLYIVSLTTFLSAVYEVTEYLGDLWSESMRVTDLYDTCDDLMWNIIATVIIVLILNIIKKPDNNLPGANSS